MTTQRDGVVSVIAHLTVLMRHPDTTPEQCELIKQLAPEVCAALCGIFEIPDEEIAAAASALIKAMETVN